MNLNPFPSMIQKLTSRRLWATVGAIGLATYELHMGHLSSADWVSVLKIVLPVWLLGESIVKVLVARMISGVTPALPPTDDEKS